MDLVLYCTTSINYSYLNIFQQTTQECYSIYLPIGVITNPINSIFYTILSNISSISQLLVILLLINYISALFYKSFSFFKNILYVPTCLAINLCFPTLKSKGSIATKVKRKKGSNHPESSLDVDLLLGDI